LVKNMKNQRLILVSNGEPYSHEWEGEKISLKKLPGGLTTGLDPLMQKEKGIWLAWGRGSADFDVVDHSNKVRVPDQDGYLLKRIKLSNEEIDNYYYGFSNEIMWPICHSFINKANFKSDYWQSYRKVNEKFARAILEEIEDDDLVWIHDYHLALVPGLITEEKSDARTGVFWHIPWPAWESFRVIPWQREIIEHLLASDFIAFHTPHLVDNFLTCAARNGARINRRNRTIILNNHQTRVTAIPLGVDYSGLTGITDKGVSQEAARLKEIYQAEKIIFGVDRLDYTKGILQRLQAIKCFFEKYPEYIGKVTLIQRLSPSRTEVKEYQDMAEEINRIIGEINGYYQRDQWMPIKSFHQSVPQENLLPYYRAADIALITPLIDGMNLVAKEYIAAQDNGVLILSRFAGAATELKEAILVNPYDIEEMAEAIHLALVMPEEEKQKRLKRLKSRIRQKDINWWRGKCLEEWKKLYA
jgi:trehalose 6-phosphate synthase/phosphatase